MVSLPVSVSPVTVMLVAVAFPATTYPLMVGFPLILICSWSGSRCFQWR
jgi:hypothetical protein